MRDTMTMQELAKEVLLAQDACNLSGLAHSMPALARAVRRNIEAGGKGWSTTDVNQHPVMRLYVHKMLSLAWPAVSIIDMAEYNKAYEQVAKLAEGGE